MITKRFHGKIPLVSIEFFIRKAGHVSEFAILALLWSLALLAKPVKVDHGIAHLLPNFIALCGFRMNGIKRL